MTEKGIHNRAVAIALCQCQINIRLSVKCNDHWYSWSKQHWWNRISCAFYPPFHTSKVRHTKPGLVYIYYDLVIKCLLKHL